MKKQELKNKIRAYKENAYENEFQIVTGLNEWNDSSIDWVWGTDADDGDEDDKYTVEVNFTDNGNIHVTLVPTIERNSGAVMHDGNWAVDEYIDEFFDELIENSEIFGTGRY